MHRGAHVRVCDEWVQFVRSSSQEGGAGSRCPPLRAEVILMDSVSGSWDGVPIPPVSEKSERVEFKNSGFVLEPITENKT